MKQRFASSPDEKRRGSLIVIFFFFFTVASPTANVLCASAVLPAAGANEYLRDACREMKRRQRLESEGCLESGEMKRGIKCAALLFHGAAGKLHLATGAVSVFFFRGNVGSDRWGKHPVPTVLHCRPCQTLRRPVRGFEAAAGESSWVESKAPQAHHVIYFRALTERTEGLRDKELITGVNHSPPDCIPAHIVMLRLLNSQLATVTIPLCVAMVMKRFSS